MKRTSKPAFKLLLKHSGSDRELRATIYLPERRRKKSKEFPEPAVWWAAKLSVKIDGRVQQHEASGEDWLQALLLAVERVRLLIPLGEEQEWMTHDGLPAWIIFPRKVPIAWGYEHWKKLVDHINEEEAAINERLADRQRRKGS